MQIVIDIPESIYKYYKNKYPKNCEELTFVENALLEGTSLPKGHGRLIDADNIQFSCGYNGFCMAKDCSGCSDRVMRIDDLCYEPTIIEADKEEREES